MKAFKSKKILFILLLVLLFFKFYLFELNYLKYHKVIGFSTFFVYFIVFGLTTAFFVKRQWTILVNLSILSILIVTIEFFSYLFLGMPAKEWKAYSKLLVPDDHKGYYLGNVPWADSVLHDVQLFEGDTFVDVHYTIDSINRRSTPGFDSAKQKYALFFGCSVCFGFGLEDDETIPYLVQNELDDYNAYNYAFNGWGPHQMLSLLEHEKLNEQVLEKDGFATYVFLWSHIRRAIGDYQVYTGWGHTMPYYAFDQDQISFKGNFAQGRPYLSGLYELLTKSYTIRLFQLNFPIKTNSSHYALVAEIIEQSKINYIEQFGNDRFTVLIYPDIWDELDGNRLNLFLDELDKRQVDYINFYDLDYLIKGSYILQDGHPNAKSNKEFTEFLIESLNVN